MPPLSVATIRCAMLHLAVGVLIGGLMLINKATPLWPDVWLLRTLHIHIVLLGWTLQLAWGVAFWILPRLNGANYRGAEWPPWVATAALNLGVALMAVEGGLRVMDQAPGAIWLLLASLCYLVAGVAMTAHLWPRLAPLFKPQLPGPEAQTGQ